MSEAAFQLTYDGEAVRDGEMDVADLAPALLAIGQMVKAASRVAFGDEAEARVRVQATREGSFAVWLSLAVHDAKVAWEFWKQPDVQAAAQLAGLLGISAASVGGGVIALVRSLRGHRAKVVGAAKPGHVLVETPDGTVEVPEAVARISNDSSFRVAMERVVAEPLAKEGIETVSIGSGSAQVITRAEADFFRAPLERDEDEFVSRYTRPFSIVSLHFTAGKKWRLSDGRGAAKLITIDDPAFNDRVARNEERFAKGDLLICDVVERSRRTAAGFKSEYEIVKVLEHRPAAPSPPELPMGEGET